MKKISEIVKGNAYVGRGIIIGADESGENAVIAYFITGRSENSRNRIFALEGGSLFTKPFYEKKVKDPSLIIYRATATVGEKHIVTNGDQTDTIVEFLKDGKRYEDALFTRTYEPDEPNFTPRISGVVNIKKGGFNYSLSILKKDKESSETERLFYYFNKVNGIGKFISTYNKDGNPLPSFDGEPKTVFISRDINEFTSDVWEGLDSENKISLYVKYVNIFSGEVKEIIKNKNGR